MRKRATVLGSLVVVGVLSAALGAYQQPPGRAGAPQGRGRGPAAPPSAAGLTVDKVRDNLYVLRGGGGNTAVFITATGVVLVDTKIAGWGQPIIERVKELTDKPVTTIINTHAHYDHSEGNVEFPPTVEVVTHENTAKLMPEQRAPLGIQRSGPNVFKETNGRNLPKRTFRDRLTLGTGNERIELHYFGRAHTSGDAFVIFPAQRVMHTGDTFPNKGIPIMDGNNGGSGVEYPETLAKAAALPNIDTVITGHFNTTLAMSDVKMYADFNRAFVDAVRAAKKAGQSVEDVVTTWKVPERFVEWGAPAQPAADRLRFNAQVVWDELK
jgi:glyoxylase-like metal-dependent hydrolase (beta-lactamase superfamily II)